MRKILFLLLLFSTCAINAQVANGTETKQNAFRSLSPQTVTSPTYVATMGADGTIGRALPDGISTENRVAVNDVSYIITGTGNKIIAYTAITADRTVTLPNAVTPNQRIWITDESGKCSNARRIIVQPNGSDTIGGESFSVINFPNGSGYLESNGAGQWNIISTTAVQFSAGVNTMPTITDNGNGSVTLGTGVYSLYANDNGTGRPKAYQIAGGTFTCTDGAMTYIVAKYNTATGAVSVTTESNPANINATTEISIFAIFRNGTTLYIRNNDTQGLALSNKLNSSIEDTQKFRIVSGGLLLGEAGTRNITTTAGTVWNGATKITVPAKNSATTATRFIFKTGGVWNMTTTVTQYNNTQWQNGGNLATLTNNRYAVNWVYVGLTNQGELGYVLGTGDYTQAEAETAQPPTDLPTFITEKMVLVGKITILKSQVSPATKIDQAQNLFLTSGGITDHNALSNVQQAGTGVPNGHISDGAQTIAGVKTFSETITANNLNLTQVDNPVFSTVADSGIAGVLNGTYYYSVTYETATGETESSGEIPITVTNRQVNITIPVSSNPLVVSRKIYRTIANPFDAVIKKLVATVTNNTDTLYVDNIPDGSLGPNVPRVNSTGGRFFVNSLRVGFANSGSTSFGLNSALASTGYANSSFGFSALTDNTTGYRNTANGVFSLFKNTTGYNNSGFGVHTLNSNTTGTDNNAFGFSATLNNLTGSNICSFGSFSASTSTSANFISAFGNASLQLNTASNNSAFGYFSGGRNTTGTGGTFIGMHAGEFNTTGNFNTSVGDGSMKANSSGSFNSIFGFQAGYNGSSFGTSNSFFGSQAGYNATGSGGVFLGKSAGYYETGDNKLFIDNQNRSSESDGRAKALVYGVFDASTSNQFLTVNGTLNSLKSRVITPLSGSSFFSSLELLRDNTLGGVKLESFRNTSTGGVGFSFNVTSDNTAEVSGTYTTAMLLDNLGILKINSLSGTGTRTVVADASGNLSATATPPARPYLVYTALISQSGTSAPTATVLENTLGATVTWSYGGGPGHYIFTAPSGTFPISKSMVFVTRPAETQSGSRSDVVITAGTNNITTNNGSLDVFESSTNTGINDALVRLSFEIRVYN